MHGVLELDLTHFVFAVVDCGTSILRSLCVFRDKLAVIWRQSRIEVGMVDEEVRAYSATRVGLADKTIQVLTIFVCE